MDTINVLAIDPGANMGVTIYTISVPELKIVNITTTVVDLSVHTVDDPLNKNLLLRLNVIKDFIRGVMLEYSPHILAMEAAFVNSRFPKSVMYLSQYIAAIELTVYEYNPYIRIFNYPPKLIKRVVNAGGEANKDVMKIALSNIPEITQYISVGYISEHEVDSIAIGYTLLKELREHPYLLWLL